MQKFLLILISIQYFFFSSVVVAANNEHENNLIFEEPIAASDNLFKLQVRYRDSLQPPASKVRPSPDCESKRFASAMLPMVVAVVIPSCLAKMVCEKTDLFSFLVIMNVPISLMTIGSYYGAFFMNDTSRQPPSEDTMLFMVDFLYSVAISKREWNLLEPTDKKYFETIFTQAYEKFKERKTKYTFDQLLVNGDITKKEFADLVRKTESSPLRDKEAIETFSVRASLYLAEFLNLPVKDVSTFFFDPKRKALRHSVQSNTQ